MSRIGPILLVDDDREEWELIEEALKQLGIVNKLYCFADGQEALDFLCTTAEKPFLILSDINMPRLGGLELRREITADEYLRKKSIPFVFLTTTAGHSAVNEAYEMSVQGFFEKPAEMEEIRKLLSEIYYYWQRCRHPNN
jgi:CheY-like chemotaxis protein